MMATKKVTAKEPVKKAGDATATKGWKEFSAWINGKDVRGGPEAQKQAAKMRADRLRKELGGGQRKNPPEKPRGGQTRRVPAKKLPNTK
jgi:hypothetical protein